MGAYALVRLASGMDRCSRRGLRAARVTQTIACRCYTKSLLPRPLSLFLSFGCAHARLGFIQMLRCQRERIAVLLTSRCMEDDVSQPDATTPRRPAAAVAGESAQAWSRLHRLCSRRTRSEVSDDDEGDDDDDANSVGAGAAA